MIVISMDHYNLGIKDKKMNTLELKAAALANELNLNKIAAHFGINRKYRWEESLKLNESSLKGIVLDPSQKTVIIFFFGSMVFVNFQHHEIIDVIKYLGRVEKNLFTINSLEYVDDYSIELDPDQELLIGHETLISPEQRDYHQEIIATILAKSVALERIEVDIDNLLDEIEDIVLDLRKGNLDVSDRKLAKTSARILGFRLNTISSIMLLDKPEITWTNEEAEALYNRLSSLFELADRYENMRHKTEMLMDITQVFTELAHNKRGNRLEWIIIILIAFEIVLSLAEKIL